MGKDTRIHTLKPKEGIVAKGKALDASAFKKRYLLKMMSSPWTLVPFLVGVTNLLGAWALDIRSGLLAFAGVASILGSAGVFVTRFLLGGDRISKDLLDEMQEEAREESEKALDHLDRQLVTDRDPRTQKCLRDLRALIRGLNESRAWASGLNVSSTFDILSGVETLFGQCVTSLQKSFDLWEMARNMATQEAREPILLQRERIVEDVQKSIGKLSSVLAGIQRLDLEDESDETELARLRKELDQSLEVARSVEKRMRDMDKEIGMRGLE